MEWGLFVLAVLFVALVQFAVWRRLQDSDVGAPDARGQHEGSRPADLQSSGNSDEPDTRLCPSCGAENGDDYRFCRECVGVLQP